MISLEQIKLLETKVESALRKIVELKNENTKLQTANMDLQAEVELLQEQCERLEQDEAKIEQGILSVLNRLNTVEDTVRQGGVHIAPPQELAEQVVVVLQEAPPIQQSAPNMGSIEQPVVDIVDQTPKTEQTVVVSTPKTEEIVMVSIPNTEEIVMVSIPHTEETVVETMQDIKETIAEAAPFQKEVGMFDSAEKSTHLDIF